MRCEECHEDGVDIEHRCPIYYTRPGLTGATQFELEIAAQEALGKAGLLVVSSCIRPDRLSVSIEVSFHDLERFGPAVRHDRRLTQGPA